MYKIKQIPEDFIVEEIPIYETIMEGEYSYFLLKKINYTTMDAIIKIAQRLRLPLRYIGFAGTKDKAAMTEQVISIKNIKVIDIEKINLKDIGLEYLGEGNNPISLGDLKGNKFKITVRSLLSKRTITKSTERIPNLFGPQRFSKNNVEIGKAIIKKNFKKAIDLMEHKSVDEFFEINPGNFIGAIRTLPLKIRMIYIHAYQSFLWNKTVEEYLKTNPFKSEQVPIVGFGTELSTDKISDIIKEILHEEGINLRDFIIPQMPELSSEGTERNLFINPQNLTIEIEEDELNENKFKAIVKFILPKGSYATIIIDYLFQGV
jgi:tRNA pseudouridine13 synthase